MQFVDYYRHALACWLLAATLEVGAAHADTLPWLANVVSDPFAPEKKAAALVSPDLKPHSCGQPDTARKLTFNEIVIASLCHNPATKAAYLSLVAQAASYVGNYSGYLPTATANYGHARTTSFAEHSKSTLVSTSSGLTLGMTLYDFGQREFRLESAEFSLIAAGDSYNSTLQGAIGTALQGYYTLLTAQNGLEVTKESEGYAKASYDAAKLRHHIGQVPLADELQAKAAYSQALLATEQAENGVSLQQASLALLMGLKADTEVKVADVDDRSLGKDPFGGKVQTLMEEALQKRNDLLASRASLKASETSLEALKRSDLATLSVTTNMNASSDVFNPLGRTGLRSQAIGLSVSIPIFTGYSATYNELAAKKSLEAQRETLTNTELSVEQDVWSSWHNYETAKQSWQTSQEALENATHLKDVALGRYKEGLGTILDVLNAETQYNSALQSTLQSRYSLLTSRVDLVRSVGVLNLETMQPEKVLAVSAPQSSEGGSQ